MRGPSIDSHIIVCGAQGRKSPPNKMKNWSLGVVPQDGRSVSSSALIHTAAAAVFRRHKPPLLDEPIVLSQIKRVRSQSFLFILTTFDTVDTN